MKLLKKLTAALLCIASVFSLLVLPAGAATQVSTFSDITDPRVGQAVETLRTMGVIDGVGDGRYNPTGPLTRAQFCKILVLIMGRGNEVDAYATKTIFPDVSSRHWARGYVNLAASTQLEEGTRLIMGVGDGTFSPDRTITYGEAVTILLRVLGYTANANANWPTGAVTTARVLGLESGLGTPAASSSITRAQAALLFHNLLTTKPQGSTSIYAATLGSLEPDTLLLSCSATTQDGSTDAVQTLKGTYRVSARQPASFFQGKRGTALFDKEGRFLTFLPEQNTSSRNILTSGATATALMGSDGAKYPMTAATAVWYNGELSTYGELLAVLNRPSTSVTIYYTAAGAVDYLYVSNIAGSNAGNVTVVADAFTGNPFAGIIAGASGYSILKNGAAATLADVRQYDVGLFDAAANTLYITDFRLTGVYQSSAPNLTAPTSITLSGREESYQLLADASTQLAAIKPGVSVTLLFTPDGKVASVLPEGRVSSNAIGILTAGDSNGDITVELLNAPAGISATLKGTFSGTASDYQSHLVRVTCGAKDALYLGRMSAVAATDDLNVSARTIGTLALADNVRIFERVGNSILTAITLADLTVGTVPAAKIAYLGTDYAGRVNLMILDDVTGDRYTYGLMTTRREATDSFGGDTVYNTVTTVTNGSGSTTVVGSLTLSNGGFGGAVASVQTLGTSSFFRPAGLMELKSVAKVSLSNFNLQTNRFFSGSVDLPIADNVQCYNAATKTWFTSLRQCLYYSDNLTVFYDRPAEEGGKVRVIVAN